jgi:phenylacetate-coenzyme A ligase PaaK-like adenylate-forming protein
VCHAAKDKGIDIAGARFLMGGEPVTENKRKEIESTGALACVGYATSEAGFVGANCFNPVISDDVHLFKDSFALIQHKRIVPHADITVDAFLVTSLLPATPKVLLNTESGDYGVVESRNCGCDFDKLGFNKHLYNIRGFDRLTSEGMNFFGSDLVRIIEEVLPAKYGGTSTDYQIVEDEEEQGQTKMNILVNPRLGDIDEAGLIRLVLDELAEGGDAPRMMSQIWLQTETLRVKRVKPITTVTGKLLPLHIQRVKQREL